MENKSKAYKVFSIMSKAYTLITLPLPILGLVLLLPGLLLTFIICAGSHDMTYGLHRTLNYNVGYACTLIPVILIVISPILNVVNMILSIIFLVSKNETIPSKVFWGICLGLIIIEMIAVIILIILAKLGAL